MRASIVKQVRENLADSGSVDELSTGVLAHGTILPPHYQITALIASGATSTVYRGLNQLLSQEVAIKVIHPGLLADSESAERFLREARIVSSLDHENLVKLMHYGRDAVAGHFLVLELIDAVSLKHVIQSGALNTDRAINYFQQICRGIEHVHANGLLHRDLKPENILVKRDGLQGDVLKIIDFGLACWRDTTADREQKVTRTGTVLGTPAYMSPEQCSGQTLDVRSDIYSLGCIFYEVLCGAPPFVEKTAMLVCDRQIRSVVDQIPALESIPVDLEAIVLKMLRKDPVMRFQSVREIRLELDTIDFQHVASAPKKALRRSYFFAASALAAILSIFGFVCLKQQNSVSDFSILNSSRLKDESELKGKTAEEKVRYYTSILESGANLSALRSAEIHRSLAIIHASSGNRQQSFAHSENCWKFARSVCDEELSKSRHRSATDFSRGVVLIADSGALMVDFTRAYQDLSRYMQSDIAKAPGMAAARAQCRFGMICKAKGLYGEAADAFRSALHSMANERSLKDEFLCAQIQLSSCLWCLGHRDEAGKLLAETIRINAGERPETSLLLAEQLSIQKQIDAASRIVNGVKAEIVARNLPQELADFYLLKARIDALTAPGKKFEAVYGEALKYAKPGSGKFSRLMADVSELICDGRIHVDVEPFLTSILPGGKSAKSDTETAELVTGIAAFCMPFYRSNNVELSRKATGVLVRFIPQCSPAALSLCRSALVDLSNVIVASDDHERAYELIDSARNRFVVGSSVGNTETLLTIRAVEILIRMGRFAQAERELGRLSYLDPRKDSLLYIQYCLQQSIVLRRTQRVTQAAQLLEQAESIARGRKLSVAVSDELMRSRASLLMDTGDLNGAIDLLEKLVNRHDLPASCLASDLVLLALVYRLQSNDKAALDQYDRYFEITTNAGGRVDPKLVKVYGDLCRHSDKSGARIEQLKRRYPGFFQGRTTT